MIEVKISIASYSFHGLFSEGQIDLFGYLEACKFRYHLGAADIWNKMMAGLDADYLGKVKRALEERELLLASLGVDDAPIWDDDPDLRKRNNQLALAHIRAGEMLGARTIRIDAGGTGEAFSEEQFDWIVKRYREFAQRAYDFGYKIGPANMRGPGSVTRNLLRICRAVNHPGFGVVFHFCGDDEDAALAPWAMHVHFSWEITHGCLEESMDLLRRTGFTGYWGVEHQSGKNEYVNVAIQLAQVGRVLASWNGKNKRQVEVEGSIYLE